MYHSLTCSVISLSLLMVAPIATADEADDAKGKLLQAEQNYENEREKFKKSVADLLDKREEASRKVGDKKALDEIKAQRKSFEDLGESPGGVPIGLQKQVIDSRAAVDKAYAAAIRSHIKLKKDNEADVLEKEHGKFILGSAFFAGKRTYLSGLKPLEMKSWNNFFEKDTDKFKIGDKAIAHSVFMHPEYQGEATASYTLPVKAVAFRATMGLPKYTGNTADPHSVVAFEVLADGKSVWKSAPVTKLDTFQTCTVRIEKVKTLTLRVTCEREHGGAHAVWFAPFVIE